MNADNTTFNNFTRLKQMAIQRDVHDYEHMYQTDASLDHEIKRSIYLNWNAFRKQQQKIILADFELLCFGEGVQLVFSLS